MPITHRHLAFLGSALLLCCPACQPQTADVEAANEEIVQAKYEAIDAQDFARLDELIAEDFVGHVVGFPEPLDKSSAFGLIRAWYRAFPDYVYGGMQLVPVEQET